MVVLVIVWMEGVMDVATAGGGLIFWCAGSGRRCRNAGVRNGGGEHFFVHWSANPFRRMEASRLSCERSHHGMTEFKKLNYTCMHVEM